jgi:hypothetical protein
VKLRWSPAEATLLRATGFIHLMLMLMGLFTPAQLFSAWGLPHAEPATFLRFMVVVYGALGLALLRAVRVSRDEGRLLVETIALVKLAFVSVVIADILARKLPNQAGMAVILDVIFGVALFRASRRSVETAAPSP